jgi:hypothetical protein
MGCATTKTDTAERSISISRESLGNLGVSPSVDMLPFGVTIPAAVLQRSVIPEGLMNYRVCIYIYIYTSFLLVFERFLSIYDMILYVMI